MSTEVLDISPGYGLNFLSPEEIVQLPDLMNHILVWERPRASQLYVLSADVSDGMGLDRSCVDVTRIGTVQEPDEQVAQFVSDTTEPHDLAYIVDIMGRMYTGADNLPAVAAVEINNHGLSTQDQLARHLGYENLYVWEHLDAADPSKRRTTKIGWETNRRTRPLIIAYFVKKVKTVDTTGVPDYRLNSPFTIEELRDFQTLTTLAEAEADPTAEDAHDDCIMCAAIGLYICQTIQFEKGETVADRRRRKVEESVRRAQASARGLQRDFRNTDATYEEMHEWDYDA